MGHTDGVPGLGFSGSVPVDATISGLKEDLRVTSLPLYITAPVFQFNKMNLFF